MEAALNGPAGRIPLGGPGLTIGRAPDNGFVIADPKALRFIRKVRGIAW